MLSLTQPNPVGTSPGPQEWLQPGLHPGGWTSPMASMYWPWGNSKERVGGLQAKIWSHTRLQMKALFPLQVSTNPRRWTLGASWKAPPSRFNPITDMITGRRSTSVGLAQNSNLFQLLVTGSGIRKSPTGFLLSGSFLVLAPPFLELVELASAFITPSLSGNAPPSLIARNEHSQRTHSAPPYPTLPPHPVLSSPCLIQSSSPRRQYHRRRHRRHRELELQQQQSNDRHGKPEPAKPRPVSPPERQTRATPGLPTG